MTAMEKVREILELKLTTSLSNRDIAEKVLGSRSKESTVRDILRRYYSDGVPSQGVSGNKPVQSHTGASMDIFETDLDPVAIETSSKSYPDSTHLMIPDTQVKEGISLDYLKWVGRYIADKQPDTIIHIGDHADMPSLSSYDKGKGAAEGRRVKKDIEAAIRGMNTLLRPLYNLQQEQKRTYGRVLYKPRMVMTLGNHEERIMRHVNSNPELQGFLSYDSLRYKDNGWEVYDYLEPVVINGVTYCHFMANPMTGKPYGGTAQNILRHVGESFCMGHKQTLDVATRFLPASGKQQWAIICGACYAHDEGYKGYQGNKHYRGIVVQHNTQDGSFDPMFVSLDYLEKRYA